MSAPAEPATALVLRCTNYGEADRVVTLLTLEHGRVSALARAARKSKKRFAGALEGFALIAVDLTFGRGQLAQLSAARVTRVFPRLLTDLARLETAGALLRIARDLLPERVPDESVFELLCEALQLLDEGELSPRALGLCGSAQLLSLTGYAPHLGGCVGCGKEPGAEQAAMFDPERGSIVCRACGGGPERMSGKARGLLSWALEAPLREAAERAAEAPVAQLREAERLLSLFARQVLARSSPG